MASVTARRSSEDHLVAFGVGFAALPRFCEAGSYIRLTPSGIRYASFMANKISLKPQGFNITVAIAIISLFAKAKNIT